MSPTLSLKYEAKLQLCNIEAIHNYSMKKQSAKMRYYTVKMNNNKINNKQHITTRSLIQPNSNQ